MARVKQVVDDRRFQLFIVAVILLNAAVLGLMTVRSLPAGASSLLGLIDNLCLAIFCVELAMKLAVWGPRFFRDGWNVFDLLVVGVALVPASGPLAVLRTLRVLRLLRLATAVPAMKRVVTGMFVAIPGGASVAGVLLVLYYVGAVIGYNLFSQKVPQHFGDIGTTFYTLFKLMTLEGWPDIASDVLQYYPHAWIFFVVFIVFTTFTTLNLLFGIIVDAMEKAKEVDAREELAGKGLAVSEDSTAVRLALMDEDLREVRRMLAEMKGEPVPPPRVRDIPPVAPQDGVFGEPPPDPLF